MPLTDVSTLSLQWTTCAARSRSDYGTPVVRHPGDNYRSAQYSLPPRWTPVELSQVFEHGYARIRWQDATGKHEGWVNPHNIDMRPSDAPLTGLGCDFLAARLNAIRDTRLTRDIRLDAAALDQATWAANTDQFQMHQRPDGCTPYHRALDQRYTALTITEVAYGLPGAVADVTRAWRVMRTASSERARLMDDQYTDVGIAAARGVWGTVWVIVLAQEAPRGKLPFPRVRRAADRY